MDRFPRYFILDANGDPQPVDDALEWGLWFEAHPDERRIAQDRDEAPGTPDIWVSTVFLGLDHNYYHKGPPLIYETMVFGGPLDQTCERYSTKAEALAGHQVMCRRVKAALTQR